MTFPAHVGQIPIYYQNKSTGRPTALKQTYKASYIEASTEPAYPFGYETAAGQGCRRPYGGVGKSD